VSALLWVIAKLAKLLPPPRVLYSLDGSTPYLSRWYLMGRPRMLDGGDPFDSVGNKKPEAITQSGPTLVLHQFHRGDQERDLHNHPVKFAASLVLAGGYIEFRRTRDGTVQSRMLRRHKPACQRERKTQPVGRQKRSTMHRVM
jgi:hypothetical protein